jgi:hypothetical protein
MVKEINVYLEIGKKRTFAGALDWPGWCRAGRDEESALQALFEYGSRYARVVGSAKVGFQAPIRVSDLIVVERLKGNATTDFGAPGLAPSRDAEPVHADELHDFEKLLKASWRAFAGNVKKARGKSLRSGPRGGGRQVERIIQHLLDSDGEIPAKGPRGGLRWTARYFVRRIAWHMLDHAWEIEDRIN